MQEAHKCNHIAFCNQSNPVITHSDAIIIIAPTKFFYILKSVNILRLLSHLDDFFDLLS